MQVATRLAAGALALGACAAPATPRADGPAWRYDVVVEPSLDLRVEASFQASFAGELAVDDAMTPFVDAPVKACAGPCVVRYRVRLAQAAKAIADVDTAILAGGSAFAPPSSWLLRPATAPDGARYRVHVTTPPGVRFVTGLRSIGAGSYEAAAAGLDEASFSGFGPLHVREIGPGASVAIAAGLAVDDDLVARWMKAELDAVTAYLRRVPDDRVTIFAVPGTQDVTRGKTLGDGGASVFIRVGSAITKGNALEDWVVAHELVHVGTPSVPRAEDWFAEGLATYIEPVLRARAGLTTPERVWGELYDNLPQGVPADGAGGLDGERDFGRVYWGGALTFLLADVAIRERTGGARSLDDAVRAWGAAGGNTEAHWPASRCVAIGDQATGTTALSEVHARFATKAAREDLAALWARLGVRRASGAVVFDDDAPLAAVRRAITGPPQR